MKQSLFNIQSEYLALASALEQGEVTPELEQQLAITEQALQTKAVGYAHIIRESEANVTAIKDEIARLQALLKSEQNKADRLKSAISNAMQMFGVHEVKTPLVRLSFRKSEAVVGEEDAPLPDEFVRVVPEKRSPDLTAIKAAIKEGREVEGYCIEERLNLQIK
jgi:hypothetical protein